jgi:uncharacterized membrane protein
MDSAIRLFARAVEVLGAVVIAHAMVRAVAAGVRTRWSDTGLVMIRRQLAQGVVAALGLMTAATLLKTIGLRSWSAIGMFAAILALRMMVKRALAAETR